MKFPDSGGLSRISLFLLLSVCCTYAASAQILNSDRMFQVDSLSKDAFTYVFGVSGSIDKQNRNLINATASNELTWKLNERKKLLTLLGRVDLVTNGSDIIQNTGYLHVRFRDNDRLKFSPEYFSQFQWNGVLGLQSRYLIGSNLRWMAIRQEKIQLFAGIGLFGEKEDWNYSGVNGSTEVLSDSIVEIHRFRINHYVKFSAAISEITDIVLQEFIQVNPMALNQVRCSIQASFQFKAGKHFSFLIGYDGMYDTMPVVPISKYLFGLASELRVYL